jgi:hypothetical protein
MKCSTGAQTPPRTEFVLSLNWSSATALVTGGKSRSVYSALDLSGKQL